MNGSRIISLPGTEQTIRGYSQVRLLVIDEAARVTDALYYAIRPMLAVSGGRLIALSTPAGKRGFFYEEYTAGLGWERVQVSAEQCPRISVAFLEEERSTLPALWFQSEYMCQFTELINAVFSEDDIDRMFEANVRPWFPEGI